MIVGERPFSYLRHRQVSRQGWNRLGVVEAFVRGAAVYAVVNRNHSRDIHRAEIQPARAAVDLHVRVLTFEKTIM